MKRIKHQSTVAPEGAGMDSEMSEKIDCNGTMTSSSLPHGNVCYNLRNRPIFYFNKCGKHDESLYISDKENNSVSQPSSVLGTGHVETNVVTENFRGRRQIGVSTFTQQLQTLSKKTEHFTNDNCKCEPTIMRLPNEVLTMIFSYFDVRELSISVAPVCKHWYTVAHSSVLWRKLCFNGDGISTEKAKCLLTKSPLLSEVIISNR